MSTFQATRQECLAALAADPDAKLGCRHRYALKISMGPAAYVPWLEAQAGLRRLVREAPWRPASGRAKRLEFWTWWLEVAAPRAFAAFE